MKLLFQPVAGTYSGNVGEDGDGFRNKLNSRKLLRERFKKKKHKKKLTNVSFGLTYIHTP